jgi:C-methyltransferase C-terminal domain/Putative zinc binding domain/Methyltransferase domain
VDLDRSATHACRSCGGPPPEPFLDLGLLAVANRLPTSRGATEERFPLRVGLCEACALVQLTWALPAEALFDEDYPYFSSYSDTLVDHARRHVAALVADRGLGARSLVVEVASNDGYLLQHLVTAGVPVVGVEPTPGPAAAAVDRGIPTVQAFFGRGLARRLVDEHGRADVVIANNVLAHVPDLDDFMGGLALLVGDDGVVTIENPGVGALLEACAFDTIYHEHYCYLSCLSVQALAQRHGLSLVDVEEFPELHGGTLRWHLARRGRPAPAVDRHLTSERTRGLDRLATYRGFGARVSELQRELRAELEHRRALGQTVAAYGAAAKGATLLGSSGVDHRLVDFVVDRNEHKQGRFLPGTGIPILAPEAIAERSPDVLLLLAWNIEHEVVRQQRAYLEGGGELLVPVPRLRTVRAPSAAGAR